MLPRWLIVLILFVVASAAAQWSLTRETWSDPNLPVMFVVGGERQTPAGNAAAAGCFPGIGLVAPPSYRPRVDLSLVVWPIEPAAACGAIATP